MEAEPPEEENNFGAIRYGPRRTEALRNECLKITDRLLQSAPVADTAVITVLSQQYVKHPEYKGLAPDGDPCKADSHGLLQRYPVTASEFILIGKETERGWEQAEDISTLLPSLKRYERNTGTANQCLRERLQKMSLNVLQKEGGLSRNTILRARRGQRVHPRLLQRLRIACDIFSARP